MPCLGHARVNLVGTYGQRRLLACKVEALCRIDSHLLSCSVLRVLCCVMCVYNPASTCCVPHLSLARCSSHRSPSSPTPPPRTPGAREPAFDSSRRRPNFVSCHAIAAAFLRRRHHTPAHPHAHARTRTMYTRTQAHAVKRLRYCAISTRIGTRSKVKHQTR